MSPRLLLVLAAAALLGVISAAAWALTRPAEERDVPPIRIESAAPAGPVEEREERADRPRERRSKAKQERERRGGFAPAGGEDGARGRGRRKRRRSGRRRRRRRNGRWR